MMLCFARDVSVSINSRYVIHSFCVSSVNKSDFDALDEELLYSASSSSHPSVVIPFNGVQPYLGLTIYFAPLCYLYTHKQSALLYGMGRYLYQQLWCQCNVLSADPGCLLYLCKLFESLLFSSHPKLFLHLVTMGIQPLKVVFILLTFFSLEEATVHLLISFCCLDRVSLDTFRIRGVAGDRASAASLGSNHWVHGHQSFEYCSRGDISASLRDADASK